jgi:hypothetical protein
MSNIGDYQALVAAAAVSFTSQSLTPISLKAQDAKDLKNSVTSSAFPVRLLLPYSDREEMSAEMGEFFVGNESLIRWRFVDQLLWRPATQGIGLEDSAYDLREYASAYMTLALALDASSISDRMTLESINVLLRDDIRFPRLSDNMYIGADVIWTVTEDDPL